MKKILLLAATLMIGINAFAQEEMQVIDEQAFCTMLAENMSNEQTSDIDLSQLQQVSIMGEDGVLYTPEAYLSGHPNRIAASLFAIFLGDLGIQHFYTGRIVRGILDIAFCWTGIPALVGLVEGIIWLCEGEAAWEERCVKWGR